MDIGYVIREKNDRNTILSECSTPCVWEACAELLLKCRIKNMGQVSPEVYIMHKKDMYLLDVLFIALEYKMPSGMRYTIELKTVRKKVDNLCWDSTNTDDFYLSSSYIKRHKEFVKKIKLFINNRSLFIFPLVSCVVKNNGHIFWDKYLSGDQNEIHCPKIGQGKNFWD